MDQLVHKDILVTVAVVLILAGCTGGSSNLAQLSTYELIEQNEWCESTENPSPGAAISCTNIVKECKRRSSTRGYKLC